jgi:hypothetical protein
MRLSDLTEYDSTIENSSQYEIKLRAPQSHVKSQITESVTEYMYLRVS